MAGRLAGWVRFASTRSKIGKQAHRATHMRLAGANLAPANFRFRVQAELQAEASWGTEMRTAEAHRLRAQAKGTS